MTAAGNIPEFLTVTRFIAWDAPGGAVWQLVDGMPQAMAPASGTHAVIQGEVGSLIRNHLAARAPDCRMLINPGVVPRLQSDNNFRIPDIAVTCAPIRRGEVAIADPVLVVEILSPSNQPETWPNVWSYATIPSVREILIIRIASIGTHLLRRNADGTWPERPLVIEDGDLNLESINFRVPVTALYAGTWLTEPA